MASKQNLLEIRSLQAISDFFGWDELRFWCPALISAIVIFGIQQAYTNKPSKWSGYVPLFFIACSVVGFHVYWLLVADGVVQKARDEGWLFNTETIDGPLGFLPSLEHS